MSSPVTAGQVAPGVEVYHDGHLCEITECEVDGGMVDLTWREQAPGGRGHLIPAHGRFAADEPFGDIVAL